MSDLIDYLKKEILRLETDLVRLTGFHQAISNEIHLKKKQLEELNGSQPSHHNSDNKK